jgi:hypothetical protein
VLKRSMVSHSLAILAAVRGFEGIVGRNSMPTPEEVRSPGWPFGILCFLVITGLSTLSQQRCIRKDPYPAGPQGPGGMLEIA